MNKQVRPPQIDGTQQKQSVDDLLREFSSGISYRALEPRIAFDGAAVATAAATADAQHQPTESAAADSSAQQGDAHNTPHAAAPEKTSDNGDAAHATDAQHGDSHSADASEALADALMTTDAPAENAPVTIVFIDKSVENIGQIVSSTDPSWEIVMIDDASSGLDQMASYLAGRTDVGSIHVVSHGEAGTLYLGTDALTNANLSDFQAQLTAIGQALNDNGDILLYGCEIGAGTGGMDFVRAFAALAGLDARRSEERTRRIADCGASRRHRCRVQFGHPYRPRDRQVGICRAHSRQRRFAGKGLRRARRRRASWGRDGRPFRTGRARYVVDTCASSRGGAGGRRDDRHARTGIAVWRTDRGSPAHRRSWQQAPCSGQCKLFGDDDGR